MALTDPTRPDLSEPDDADTQSVVREAAAPVLSEGLAKFAQRLEALAAWDSEDTGSATAAESAVDRPAIPGYECLKELGRGGMGVVYKARQAILNRHVALKVMKDAAGAGPVELARFLDEAEAVAAIDHPNVVRVHDYGEHDRRPYLVMEYLSGGSLADRLAREGRLDPSDAAELVEKLGRAVQAAHALGIVHRDLKPHNVLLDADGQPKVTDFGLARRGQSRDLTVTGAIMGTPEYMAPEQASGRGKYAGAPVDVWALGVILYECLTGTRPFTSQDDLPRAQNALVILRKIETDAPARPRGVAPSVPRDLELICLKCLEKDPRDRYPTAGALADDLRQFRNGEPVTVRAAGASERLWKWSRRHKALAALYAVIAVTTVALVGLGFWFSNRIGAADGHAAAARSDAEAADSRAAAARADELRAREVAATEGYARLMTELRDRESATRTGWRQKGLNGIRRLVSDGLPPIARTNELRTEAAACLTGTDLGARELARLDAAALAFHPDGRWVAVGQSRAQLFAVCNVFLTDPVTGDRTRTLTFAPSVPFQIRKGGQDGPRCLAVSPDGRWLVAGARSGMLHRWDLAAAGAVATSWEGHAAEVTQAAFAPDGSCFYTGSADGTVKRWGTGDTKPVAAWKAPGPVHTVVPLPGGWEVVCGWSALPADAALLSASDLAPVRGVWQLTADGSVLVPTSGLWVRAYGRSLALIDPRSRDDSTVRQLRVPDREHAHEDGVRRIAVSPDGRFLASAADDHHIRLWDLVSGRLLIDLPIDLGGNGALGWHPDGRTLVAAAANRVLAFNVAAPGITGSVNLPGFGRGTAWSPDGTTLATAASNPRGAHDVRFWPARLPDTGPAPSLKMVTALPHGNRVPSRSSPTGVAFSPDGSRCAFLTEAGVSLFDPTTGSQTGLLPASGGNALCWGPDGRLWAAVGTAVQSWSVPTGAAGPGWSNATADRLTGRGTVNAVAAGRVWVLAATRDGAVHLLNTDAKSDRHWTTSGSAECVALSANESVAAVGTETGEVRVFRVPDGEMLGRLPNAHRESVNAMVFVSDRLLATGSRDATVRLWTWTEGRLQEILTLRTTGAVVSLNASRDGSQLTAAVTGELGVRVWRLDRLWSELSNLGLDPGFPQSPGVLDAVPSASGLNATHQLPDGTVTWSGVEGPGLNGWAEGDSQKKDAPPVLVRLDGWLKAPAPGRYALSAWAADGIRVWLDGALLIDAADRKFTARAVEVELTGRPQSIRVEYRRAELAPGYALFWELPPQSGTGGVPVTAAHLFRDRRAAEQATVPPVSQPPHGEEVRSFPGCKGTVQAVCVSPNGSRVAIAGDRSIWLWDAMNGDQPIAVRGDEVAHGRGLTNLSYSPTGDRLASTGSDRCVRFWEPELLQPKGVLGPFKEVMSSVCWSRDGTKVVCGARPVDKILRVFDVRDEEQLVLLHSIKTANNYRVATGYGEDRLLAVSGGPELVVWPADVWSKNVVRADVRATPLALRRADASRDGRWIVAASRTAGTGHAVLWDETKPGVVRCRWVNPIEITGVCFSPDGRSFATAGRGPVRLWDTETGVELARFGKPDDESESVCFTPDGLYILAGGSKRLSTVQMWRIPTRPALKP